MSSVAYEFETGIAKLAFFGMISTDNYGEMAIRVHRAFKTEAARQHKSIDYALGDRAKENAWTDAYDEFLSTNFFIKRILEKANLTRLVYAHSVVTFVPSEVKKIAEKQCHITKNGMSHRDSSVITNSYSMMKDQWKVEVNGKLRTAGDHKYLGPLLKNFHAICESFSREEPVTPEDNWWRQSAY